MHHKGLFALAGIFLSIALVVPPVALFLQGQSEIEQLIVIQNNPGHVTAGNVTFVQQIIESRQTTYMLIVAVEAVFISLFVVTMYYGIKHIHPTHRNI